MESSARKLNNKNVDVELLKRQRRSERNKRYRLKNKEKIRESYRSEYGRDKARARYAANKEIISKQRKAKYAEKKEVKKRIQKKQSELLSADSEFKPAREIKNPVKTWTPAEEYALIYFLKENLEFEQPTANLFYKRFLQSNNSVNTDWRTVRSKVLNMQTAYNKAKEWLQTMGEDMTDTETVKNTICDMCPFYYEFAEIYKSNLCNLYTNLDSNQSSVVKLKPLNDGTSEDAYITIVKTEKEDIENVNNDMSRHYKSFSGSQTLSSQEKLQTIESIPDNIPITNCSEVCFNLVVSEFLQSQADILKFKEEKVDCDTVFREKKMQLLERQIALQEKKLDIREKQLKSQEHIKMLELKMKERLAMKELVLKYRN